MAREFVNTVKTLFTDDQLKQLEQTSSEMGMNLSEFLRCSAMHACRLSQAGVIDAGDLKPFNREYGAHKEIALVRKGGSDDKTLLLRLPRGAFNGGINEGFSWIGVIMLHCTYHTIRWSINTSIRALWRLYQPICEFSSETNTTQSRTRNT